MIFPLFLPLSLPAAVWAIGAQSKLTMDKLDIYSESDTVMESTFSQYRLRITSRTPSLCDPTVQQYAGYLDISENKHLFFWFFESRQAPETAPLTLWLNGGPGGSSMLGMLFELGPCNIENGGNGTTFNKHSWNTYSNMIFLDQPAGVGFSYSEGIPTMDNTRDAAEDVYAFLQLFLEKYPKYSSAPFHIAAESYGGTYAPHIASAIHKHNKARSSDSHLRHVNLASVMLGNGMTDPYYQQASYADYACEGPFALFEKNSSQCDTVKRQVPTCQRLIQNCYDFDTIWTCFPAMAFCEGKMYEPFNDLPINMYDVRKKCDHSDDGDGQLCYKEFSWIETWLNMPETKKAIGIDPDVHFQAINFTVNTEFTRTGDGMRNSAALLPELIDDGVRLLVYVGVTDLLCNYMGNEAWMNALKHSYHEEFVQSSARPWYTLETSTLAGEVRSAGADRSTAGNVTFVKVFEAGHMVPYDQPEAALDLFKRWIEDSSLTL